MSLPSSNSAPEDDPHAACRFAGPTASLPQQPQPQPQPQLFGPLLSVSEIADRCLTEQATADLIRLHPEDIERLRVTYSSQSATCYVCPCIASVYQKVEAAVGSWRLGFQSGALVLLMPQFEPEEKFAQSELLFVHPGTCLALWSLRLSSATISGQPHMFFQTLTDPATETVYGLTFLDSDAAGEFSCRLLARVKEMADFEATGLKERRRTFKERSSRSRSLRRLLSQSRSSGSGGFSEISSPCVCQRVASATVQDCDRFAEILTVAELRERAMAAPSAEAATAAAANSDVSCSITH